MALPSQRAEEESGSGLSWSQAQSPRAAQFSYAERCLRRWGFGAYCVVDLRVPGVARKVREQESVFAEMFAVVLQHLGKLRADSGDRVFLGDRRTWFAVRPLKGAPMHR